MKSVGSVIKTAIPIFAMAILILDAKTALSGAGEGVMLCIRTVIPSLFPFLFFSVMVTGSLMGQTNWVLRPIGRLCRIPAEAENLLAVGLLGGYPIGAQCIAQAYREGAISKNDAHRMLGFCSNAGPSFLFGMLSGIFSEGSTAWYLWGVHLLSAILTGMLLPGGSTGFVRVSHSTAPSPAEALRKSMTAMGTICGWVVLFRVLLAFLQRWFFWLLPKEADILLSGFLELTNGCCSLSLVTDESARFVLASILLGFGGVCVGLQTVSVTQGLGTGLYFPGKLIQAGISCLLCFMLQTVLFPGEVQEFPILFLILPGILLLGLLILKNRENRSSNLARQGV